MSTLYMHTRSTMKIEEQTALIIGAGPAGLMAAEALIGANIRPLIVDAMPSPARKFLMAGKSGLNLTRDQDFEPFLAQYGPAAQNLRPMIADFGPDAVQIWARGLGQSVFTGSTGRVFPKAMKASPLLRAWLARLDAGGATLRRRWRWTGWQDDAAIFETPEGVRKIGARATILALGGASWARLGSDGKWAQTLMAMGHACAGFAPSNIGIKINWSAHMTDYFGTPIKGVALSAGKSTSRGEVILSRNGLEGGGIYTLTPAIRDGVPLHIDLKPDMDIDTLRAKLTDYPARVKTRDTLKRVGLSRAAIAMVQEFARPLPTRSELAGVIKSLPIAHAGPRPMDEAISTAGGLKWDALDENLMLKDRPGTFAAGEMLDWEAPTGGYLMTACLATGRWAGRGAGKFLA